MPGFGARLVYAVNPFLKYFSSGVSQPLALLIGRVGKEISRNIEPQQKLHKCGGKPAYICLVINNRQNLHAEPYTNRFSTCAGVGDCDWAGKDDGLHAHLAVFRAHSIHRAVGHLRRLHGVTWRGMCGGVETHPRWGQMGNCTR